MHSFVRILIMDLVKQWALPFQCQKESSFLPALSIYSRSFNRIWAAQFHPMGIY